MNIDTLKQKHLGEIRDTITADTGNWGEYGGQNRESQIECAENCKKITLQFTIEVLQDLQQDFANKFLTKSAKDLEYKISELQTLLNEK